MWSDSPSRSAGTLEEQKSQKDGYWSLHQNSLNLWMFIPEDCGMMGSTPYSDLKEILDLRIEIGLSRIILSHCTWGYLRTSAVAQSMSVSHLQKPWLFSIPASIVVIWQLMYVRRSSYLSQLNFHSIRPIRPIIGWWDSGPRRLSFATEPQQIWENLGASSEYQVQWMVQLSHEG